MLGGESVGRRMITGESFICLMSVIFFNFLIEGVVHHRPVGPSPY